MLISVIIAFYIGGTFQIVIDQINATMGLLGLVFPMLIGLMILAFISYTLLFFTALALGNMHNKDKLVHAIGYGIAIYMIMMICMLIGIGVLLLPNFDITILNNNNVPIDILTQIVVISMVVNIVFIIGNYCITTFVLKKKLNLE